MVRWSGIICEALHNINQWPRRNIYISSETNKQAQWHSAVHHSASAFHYSTSRFIYINTEHCIALLLCDFKKKRIQYFYFLDQCLYLKAFFFLMNKKMSETSQNNIYNTITFGAAAEWQTAELRTSCRNYNFICVGRVWVQQQRWWSGAEDDKTGAHYISSSAPPPWPGLDRLCPRLPPPPPGRPPAPRQRLASQDGDCSPCRGAVAATLLAARGRHIFYVLRQFGAASP